MQNTMKITVFVLIVASCAFALDSTNVEKEHAISKRSFTDVNEHAQDLGKRAQDMFKLLFLRSAPHMMQDLKRAAKKIAKNGDDMKTKIRKFLETVNIPELITDIEVMESFLGKIKRGLEKLQKRVEELKSTGKL